MLVVSSLSSPAVHVVVRLLLTGLDVLVVFGFGCFGLAMDAVDEWLEDLEVARATLLFAHADGSIDDEEFVVFWLAFEEEEREVEGEEEEIGSRLNLDRLSRKRCVELFRFTQSEIRRLCTSLRLRDEFVHVNKTTWTGLEGLCVVLRRLSYPCRFKDLRALFGRSNSELSIIFNQTCMFLRTTWLDHLINFTQANFFSPARLALYVATVAKDYPLKTCFGFIDGTVRAMCRPGDDQQLFYNGHKRVHSLKYQTIVAPDGLIVHLFGPMEGRRHDCALFNASDVLAQLQSLPPAPNGDTYCVYGDLGYALRPTVQIPFGGGNPTAAQRTYNSAMSAARICVEWGYAKVVKYFAFVDFKKNLKLLLSPISAYYFVAVLLTNCHTCLYGSETSSHFDLQPPTLEEYLN